MKDFQALKVLDRLEWLFKKANIDYILLRKILKIKLIMDKRRVPTIFNQSQAKKNKEVNYFFRSLWLYAFMGLLLIPFILMEDNYIFQMSITFAIVMFIIMSTMISDFSSVLLDLRDKSILVTKPVSRKTINATKFVHISIYMFLLTASIVTIPSIVALIKHGAIFFIFFIFEIILVNLLIIVFTALLYFLFLKFFDGEQLKDLINYFQIMLSIVIMIGYQVVVRSFEFIDLKVAFYLKWWHFFIPPIWYSAPFELLLHGKFEMFLIIFTILAIIVPILFIILYIKLMPSFERNLQKLSEQSTRKKTQSKLSLGLAKIICRDKEERTFYRFATLMMKNEREFKLKVYPSIGFSLVLPFIMLYNQFLNKSLKEIASSHLFLTIYFSMMIIPTVVLMLRYSGKYKGAWIYKTTPIQNTTTIYKGTLKAFLINLFLPFFFIISVIFGIIYRFQVLPHLIVIMLSSFVYTIISFKIIKKSLPFSESFNTMQDEEGMKLFPLFILIGFFLGIHYVSTLFHYGVYLYMIILIFVNSYIWRKV